MKRRSTTEDEITAEVLRRFEGTPDPRLRRIMLSLVRHLHAFDFVLKPAPDKTTRSRHKHASIAVNF